MTMNSPELAAQDAAVFVRGDDGQMRRADRSAHPGSPFDYATTDGQQLATCPKCGGTELTVHEAHLEHGSTDPGKVVVRNGALFHTSDFTFSPGDPVKVTLDCEACGHQWTSRRPVGGAWTWTERGDQP